MAKTYFKSKPIISKTELRYTVSYLANNSNIPSVKLSGKWLREAGLATDTEITIKIADDCIVLIPDSSSVQALREQLTQVKDVLKLVNQDKWS